jgi:hypothetical protein
MSISITDLVEMAVDASKTGGKLQSSVRKFIEDRLEIENYGEVAARVGDVITIYRNEIEDWVMQNETKIRRKVVNNIINDVSRICRDELRHSIVCTKRKGGYVYEAKEIAPKTTTLFTGGPTIPMPPAVDYEEELRDLKRQVSTPRKAFEYLISQDWSEDFIASELVAFLKARESA